MRTTTEHCGTRAATRVRPCYSYIQPDGFVVTAAAAVSTVCGSRGGRLHGSERKNNAGGDFEECDRI